MRLPWELRVNMNTQLTFGRSEYGDFLQNQLPETILFFGGQMVIIVQNMLPLGTWRDNVKTALISLKDSGQISMYDNRTIRDIIKLETRDKKYPDFLDRPVIDCFEKRASSDYTLSSVHGVKGETSDATLLIVDTISGSNALTPSILNTGSLNSELMRIAYVAMTRPRKLLVVSLPKSYNKLSRMPPSLWEYREI